MFSVKFYPLSKSSFKRIWNSAHFDQHADSWPHPIEQTPENEWRPVFENWLPQMKEAWLEDQPIGYVFLSEKPDNTAHLGFGVYKAHRRKGYGLQICQRYLERAVPRLDSGTTKLVGTTLKKNSASQTLLSKLGFRFKREYEGSYNNVPIVYLEFIKAI